MSRGYYDNSIVAAVSLVCNSDSNRGCAWGGGVLSENGCGVVQSSWEAISVEFIYYSCKFLLI